MSARDRFKCASEGTLRRKLTRTLAFRITFSAAIAAFGFGSVAARAQSSAAPQMSSHESMGMGDDIFGHFQFNQLEGRTNGPDNEFRWDGEGWVGTDMNKLWIKSEAVSYTHLTLPTILRV